MNLVHFYLTLSEHGSKLQGVIILRKRVFNLGFIFAIVGIFAGAFYREFTKFLGFTGPTTMSLVHTHLISLGSFMFLILGLIFIVLDMEETKRLNNLITLYLIGVIGNAGVMFTRGMLEVLNIEITRGINGSLSGVSGIAHILLTIGLVWILNIVRKSVKN